MGHLSRKFEIIATQTPYCRPKYETLRFSWVELGFFCEALQEQLKWSRRTENGNILKVNKLLHQLTMHNNWVRLFNHTVMHRYHRHHKLGKLRCYTLKKKGWARNIFTVQNYRIGVRGENVIQCLTPKLHKSLTNTFPAKTECGGKRKM